MLYKYDLKIKSKNTYLIIRDSNFGDKMVVKIGVIKCRNLGTSPVVDLVLDERADRPNIEVRELILEQK